MDFRATQRPRSWLFWPSVHQNLTPTAATVTHSVTLYHRSSTIGPFARNLRQTGMQDDLSQQINRVRELGKGSFNDEHNHGLTLQRNSAISSIMSHHPRRTETVGLLTPHVALNHAFSGCAAPNMNSGGESQMFLCPSQQRWPRVVVRHRSDSLEIEVVSTSGRVVLQFVLAHGVFPSHHISTLHPHFTCLSH